MGKLVRDMKNGYQPKDNGKPPNPPTTGSNAHFPKFKIVDSGGNETELKSLKDVPDVSNEEADIEPMTFQEALDLLRDALFCITRKNGKWKMPMALFLACFSLERQVAKKPVKSSTEIVCPNCRTLVGPRPFCGYCGQRIDWREEK